MFKYFFILIIFFLISNIMIFNLNIKNGISYNMLINHFKNNDLLTFYIYYITNTNPEMKNLTYNQKELLLEIVRNKLNNEKIEDKDLFKEYMKKY